MNPIWLSVMFGSVLRRESTTVRVGPTPHVRCSAKQTPRRPPIPPQITISRYPNADTDDVSALQHGIVERA